MKLPTKIFLSSALFAVFVSGVFGSDSAAAFPFAEEDKQAALRGISFIRDKITHQINRIRKNALSGLHEMDQNSPDFKAYLDSLNVEELAKEAEVIIDCSSRALTGYDSVAAAVVDGTISYDEMGNLFCLERTRLFLKEAAKKTLLQAVELFIKIYSMSGSDFDAAYSSCHVEEFSVFVKTLELAPIPELTIDRLLVFDRASAENIFKLILSANLEESEKILAAINEELLSFERMQGIAALYAGKLVDPNVKCSQSEMFFDDNLRTGAFTTDGRTMFVDLIGRIKDRYDYIIATLNTRSDEELIDFLKEIRFIDIMMAQMPFSEALGDSFNAQFYNLTTKKAKYIKAQLLKIKEAHFVLCDLVLNSPADFTCTRFNVNLVIDMAKGLRVDEGVTIEQIFIPAAI